MSRARKQQTYFHLHWKKLLHFLFFIVFLILCLLLLNDVKSPGYFPIKDVKVFGIEHLDPETVQHFLEPYVKKGFFSVEVDAIKERLLQDPWVSDVNVRRIWPDQIEIHLLEKAPVAFWNDTSMLSSKGELFVPESDTTSLALPHLVGPDGEYLLVMDYYSKINSILSPLHFKVIRLELTEGELWNVTLDNNLKITGGSKDILTRLSHFVKVYSKIVGNRYDEVDYVDLRYSNGLAVKWKT